MNLELGVIDACEHAGCGRRCCDFSSGNYIVLYPGELNEAVGRGDSLDHLAIRPSSEGGHRAICNAQNKASCDNGYKPLDCASYPLFPGLDDGGGLIVEQFGHKCPIGSDPLPAHRGWVKLKWERLVRCAPGVKAWLSRVRLIGYSEG